MANRTARKPHRKPTVTGKSPHFRSIRSDDELHQMVDRLIQAGYRDLFGVHLIGWIDIF